MPEAAPREGPRALWSGTITFGLVTVPVNLFPGNQPGGVHWRMLSPDGTPLKRRFYCPREERPVENDELVRGYEMDEGEYVVVTDEELESLAPRKSHDIDLRAFVDADQIDPVYFERSYFLTPGGDSNKAYRLLAEVMQRREQAGIATFVMRDKEYLVAILSEGGILRAETMRFQDEVRTPKDVGLKKTPAGEKKRVAHVLREIEKRKESGLKARLLTDEQSARVAMLIEKKRRRHEDTVEVDSDAEAGDTPKTLVLDLKAALRRSVGAARSHPRKAPKRRKATAARRKKTA